MPVDAALLDRLRAHIEPETDTADDGHEADLLIRENLAIGADAGR